MERMTTRLRRLLEAPELLVAPGVAECVGARLVAEQGFDALYMTGAGTTASRLGMPDVGLLGVTEMADNAGRIAEAANLPLIADADTGYGGPINVRRTIQCYERAGVAGVHMEDQDWPKRCGHLAGKTLIPVEEMCAKVRAAVDARADPDFIVIARTDARGPAGLDAAIERANRYREAGADMVFPDALLSEEEFETFARSVPGPKMMNMGGYAARRTTPKMPLERLARIGFNVVIFPLAMLRAGARAERDFLAGLRVRGTAFEREHIETLKGDPMENWYEFTGIGGIRALEARYLPEDHMGRKYEGEGYRPGTGGASAPGSGPASD